MMLEYHVGGRAEEQLQNKAIISMLMDILNVGKSQVCIPKGLPFVAV